MKAHQSLVLHAWSTVHIAVLRLAHRCGDYMTGALNQVYKVLVSGFELTTTIMSHASVHYIHGDTSVGRLYPQKPSAMRKIETFVFLLPGPGSRKKRGRGRGGRKGRGEGRQQRCSSPFST